MNNNLNDHLLNPYFHLPDDVKLRIATHACEIYDEIIAKHKEQEHVSKSITSWSEKGWVLSLLGFECDKENNLHPIEPDSYYRTLVTQD